MKARNRKLLIGALLVILLVPTDACSQHKKMPKLRNPGGQGFIPCGSCEAPDIIHSEATISVNESGERLTISGTLYQKDGKTPAPGIVLFFYHTDATGHYNRDDDPNDPRLKGWVKTDSKGHYKINTIKPGPYPSLKTPAHIHVHRFSQDIPENWMEDFWFQGDPLIKESEKEKYRTSGDFSPIVTLSKNKEGVLTGTRNLILE